MKKPVVIFLIFLAAFLAACGPSQRPALVQNRALWQSQAIQHYRFNFRIGCIGRNGADITPYLDTFRAHATIDSLFDLVDSAISRRVYSLAVQYDPKYGFPASIIINPSRLVMDDETGYYVTGLEVLP